jgi:tetratricopeptide (TPR) repeat protein
MRNRFLLLILALIFSLVGAIGENGTETSLISEAGHYEDVGDINGAIGAFKKLLAMAPHDYRVMNAIAGLFGAQGKFQEEARWSSHASKINPSFMPAFINYGNAELALGDVDEAQQSYEKAASLAPKDPLPFYSLGVIEEQKQNFEEALKFYEKTISLDSKFENGYYNAAAMLANLNRKEDARTTLNTLLSMNPKADDAKKMLSRLDREVYATKK